MGTPGAQGLQGIAGLTVPVAASTAMTASTVSGAKGDDWRHTALARVQLVRLVPTDPAWRSGSDWCRWCPGAAWCSGSAWCSWCSGSRLALRVGLVVPPVRLGPGAAWLLARPAWLVPGATGPAGPAGPAWSALAEG